MADTVPITPLDPPESVPSVPLEPAENILLTAFRRYLPEFAEWPDALIVPQLEIASRLTNLKAFGDVYPYAVALRAAHFLVSMYDPESKSTKVSATPPQQVVSKSVGGVSVSYSTTASALSTGASSLEATYYGKRLLDLQYLFGAGCIQL